MVEIVECGSRTFPDLNEAIGDFVSMLLWGAPGRFERFSSFGVFDAGTLIAGVLWHNWQPEAGVVEMSAASTDKRWLTRSVLRTMFGVPFDRWGCQLVALRVSQTNFGMVDIATRFGFRAYLIPRLRGRAEDEIIFTFTDDQWRQHPLARK